MRNKFFIINLLVMIIFAGMISGCQKEQPADKKQAIYEQNDYSKMLIRKFNNFRSKMQSQTKSGESISLDSAIWYTEATLSYDNAYPDSTSEEFFTVNTYYTLNVDNNNMVSMEDVQNVYNLMLDSLNYHLGRINEDVKFIAFADVQLNSIKNNVANIQMISGFGTGLVLGYYDPFDEDDDWIWGTKEEVFGQPPAGKCDGTMQGISDGSNELEFRFNNPYQNPTYEPFYTDYQTIQVAEEKKNGQFVTYVDFTGPQNCLYNEDLTYYLTEGHKLIYNTLYDPDYGYRPDNKDFIYIEIVDDYIESTQYNVYTHFYYITYGKPGGSPPID